jgi:hypothetical protein
MIMDMLLSINYHFVSINSTYMNYRQSK